MLTYADLPISLICMSTTALPRPDVPAQIRAELARRGWSVRELASRTGLTHVTLSRRLGRDGGHRLSVAELEAIAAAFDLTSSALVARAEEAAA